MPDIQKVSVALTGEQVAVLKAAVATGEYATTSEIVREAIRDWQFKQQLRPRRIPADFAKPGKPAKRVALHSLSMSNVSSPMRRRALRIMPPIDSRCRLTARAEGELEDIWLAIAVESPQAATKVTRRSGQKDR